MGSIPTIPTAFNKRFSMKLEDCKTVKEVRDLASDMIRKITRECTHEDYEYNHDDIQGGAYTCKVCGQSVSRLPFVK